MYKISLNKILTFDFLGAQNLKITINKQFVGFKKYFLQAGRSTVTTRG